MAVGKFWYGAQLYTHLGDGSDLPPRRTIFEKKLVLSMYRIQHPATFYICHETIIREARVIKHIMETNATNKTNVRPKTAATHLSN